MLTELLISSRVPLPVILPTEIQFDIIFHKVIIVFKVFTLQNIIYFWICFIGF